MQRPLARLLQGAGLSCGALLVGIAFGIFLTPYLVSQLGEKSYGVYTLASLFAGWCGILDFGLTTTTSRYITRYYAKKDWQGLNEVGTTAIVLFGGISCLVFFLACVACIAATLWGESLDDSGVLGCALFLSGASFAISKISDGVLGVIKGALRQEASGGATLVFRILFGVVNFGVLYFGGRVVALCLGNFLLTFAQLIVYIVISRYTAPFFRFSIGNFRRDKVRTLFRYGVFAFLAQVGEIAVNRSDLLVIAVLMTTTDVGRYNLVVVTLVSYFNSFLCEGSSWQTNWFAKLATNDPSANEPSLDACDDSDRQSTPATYDSEFYGARSLIIRASTYGAFFMAFGIFALGPAFIERWIGAQYLDAFPALAVCIAALGLYRGASETNSRMLQGVAKHRVLAYGAICHGVLNLILSVFFVKLGYGLLGVALGTALPGLFIHYCWIPNVACRLIGESRRAYWTRQLRATGTALLATAVPALIVYRWRAPDYGRIVLLGATSCVLYFGVVFWFGFSRSERAIVFDRFREKWRAIRK